MQLFLIQTITEVTEKFYGRISEANMNQFLVSMETSHAFANKFNGEINLRYKLWQEGFMGDLH